MDALDDKATVTMSLVYWDTHPRGGYSHGTKSGGFVVKLFFCRRPDASVGCWRRRLRRSCTERVPALEPITMLTLKPEPTTNTAQGENPHPFIIIRLFGVT